MSHAIIRYTSEPQKHSLGRNGYFRTTGAEISCGPGYVTITPLTSKGEPGRCEIAIPMQDIRAVAEALIRIADKNPSESSSAT